MGCPNTASKVARNACVTLVVVSETEDVITHQHFHCQKLIQCLAVGIRILVSPQAQDKKTRTRLPQSPEHFPLRILYGPLFIQQIKGIFSPESHWLQLSVRSTEE